MTVIDVRLMCLVRVLGHSQDMVKGWHRNLIVQVLRFRFGSSQGLSLSFSHLYRRARQVSVP